MARIRKLDNSVINQIAAGEVVIQPCSVLKELVENSFDAGSTRLTVEFDGSGADRIKIADDGMGMDQEDLLLSVEPHATSKISSSEDLYQVSSCGFRGEALASIAEVSKIEIVTRPHDQKKAWKLNQNPQQQFETSQANREQGTTIEIRDLFHNVPVRRRFLKSDRAETTANLDALRKLALSRPWVALKVLHDGKTCFDLEGDQGDEKRLRDLGIFDKEAQFLKLEGELEGIKVSGLVTSPPVHFGTSSKVYLFVQRRPIVNRALVQAIVQAFEGSIPERRFPGALIYLDMPADEVDVNIHPTKSEVRFRQPDQVFRLLRHSVKAALADRAAVEDRTETQPLVYKQSGVPKVIPMNRNYGGVYKEPSRPQPFREQAAETSPFEYESSSSRGFSTSPATPSLGFDSETPELSVPKKTPRTLQIMNRFILVENEESFDLYDQHALHERILYNQLLQDERENEPFTSQDLLSSVTVDADAESREEAFLEECRSMGYQLMVKGEKLEIRGIPNFMSLEKALSTLEGLISDCAELKQPDRETLRKDLRASMACRAAIKAGDVLNEEEIRGLSAALATLDAHQHTCPHGRSSVWRISVTEANKMFDRS